MEYLYCMFPCIGTAAGNQLTAHLGSCQEWASQILDASGIPETTHIYTFNNTHVQKNYPFEVVNNMLETNQLIH